jgi:glycosyltransferase involved in cell wall biosynthesis
MLSLFLVVVAEGTGYLVDDVEEMAEACGRLGSICAEDCRAWLQREFSAGSMADGYEKLIEELGADGRDGIIFAL